MTRKNPFILGRAAWKAICAVEGIEVPDMSKKTGVRSPIAAEMIKTLRPKVVKPKRGKGSYKRKGRKNGKASRNHL